MTPERIVYGLLGDGEQMSLAQMMDLMDSKREPIEQALSSLISAKKVKRIGKSWIFRKVG